MKVLLTNDDGIFAPGLKVVHDFFTRQGEEVYVVAPERERSAAGHGITVHKPLRVQEVRLESGSGWAVSGTPADCIKLALETVVPAQPDIVVSGINWGANLGTDILYSGTVSAAIEAIMAGVPAIAASLVVRKHQEFGPAAAFVHRLAGKLLQQGITSDTLLNVNVPDLPAAEIAGVKFTRLGHRRYVNSVEERTDPHGRSYYWLAGEPLDNAAGDDTDLAALARNEISVSPVHFDLTNYRTLVELRRWNITM